MTVLPKLTDAKLELDGRIATLTLSRDDVRNALTGTELIADIVSTLRWANNCADAAVLIITGAGSAFSAGGDIKTMGARAKGPAHELQRNYRLGILLEITAPDDLLTTTTNLAQHSSQAASVHTLCQETAESRAAAKSRRTSRRVFGISGDLSQDRGPPGSAAGILRETQRRVQRLRMKMLFSYVGCAVLLALTLTARAATPVPEPAFVPRDEGAGDVSWTRFRDQLLAAVQRRDKKFVLGIVDRNVRNGLERPRGMEEFIRQWGPDSEDGPLWRELPRALHLAAAYYRHDHMPRSLCAPYVLPQWPKDIDPHGHGAVTARQTEVRAAPSGGAVIQGTLGQVIVRVADWEVADHDADIKQKWVKIRTQERDGYIPEEHIRSPVEHLACFRKDDSGWRLTSFLAAGE